MQQSFQSSEYFNGKSGIPHKTIALTFGISLACHAVLIGILFFLPGYGKPLVNPFPSAINVSLVSLPAGRPGPAAGKPAVTKKESFAEKQPVKKAAVMAEKPKEIVKPVVKAAKIAEKVQAKPVVKAAKVPEKIQTKPSEKVSKAVSLNPKPATKKEAETSELIKNAVKDMEKRVGESRPASVADAISRMKSQIDSGEKTGKTQNASQSKGFGIQGSGTGGPIPGIPGGSGSSNLPIGALDIYKAQIFSQIQQNWAYSEQIGGRSPGSIAVLVIKIMHNGEISDIRFESRSQNRYLDESAYRAIQKSNPLPPLPDEYGRTYYEVGLRFGTGGLKQK